MPPECHNPFLCGALTMAISTKQTPVKEAGYLSVLVQNAEVFRDPRAIVAFEGSRSALTQRRCAAAPGVTIGALVYLLSLGLVGAATIGAFFGVSLMTAGSDARHRTPPPEAELSPWVAAAVLPVSPSPFLQEPATQAAIVPETSGAARGPEREFSAPLGSGAGALPAKAPRLRSAAHKVKHLPPSLTGPVPRLTARNGTLTPPTQTGPATLTPPPGY
jgi:hypothetical protein